VIKSGTIKLPYDDPITGMMGTWNLDAGTGARSYVSPDIQFVPPWGGAGSPFGSPPNVVVSLAGIEATGGLARVSLSVENVQAEEFNIRVNVSEDCTLNKLWVTWVAYDAV
jgi:H-type lectin domain